MLERFANTVDRLIGKNQSEKKDVALAVSGGVDSMTMTFLVSQLVCKMSLNPIVLIVDHQLREESTSEAKWTQEYIREKFGTQTIILTWDHKEGLFSNIQHKAREARYDLMVSYCKLHNIQYLLTAHNKNDQAETVLMRILRGSGIDGICGIRERSIYNKCEEQLMMLRPMLSFLKDEIYDYARENRLQWVEDMSNSHEKYFRTKMRKILTQISDEISPVIDYDTIISRLCLLANNAQRSNNFIEKYVNERMSQICTINDLGVIFVKISDLVLEDEEVALRILQKVLTYYDSNKYPPRFKSLKQLYTKILEYYRKEQSFTMTINDNLVWFCRRKSDKVWILVVSKEMKSNTDCTYEIKDYDKEHIWNNRFKISVEFLFEKHNARIFIHPIGKMWNEIKKSDYKVIDEDKYKNMLTLVQNIPKLDCIISSNPLLRVVYNCGEEKLICPSIGLAT